jgi:hypothetical protein
VPSIDKRIFIKELTWQAIRRWWEHDVLDPWRAMDRPTYRAAKRRARRRALRDALDETQGEP